MLRFLRLEPLAKDWKQLCNLSTVPHQLPLLMDVVKTFLHRNMKFNVQDEIDIPTQNEKTFHLKFSKVEAHRYSSLVDEFKEELAVISRKAARSGNLQISARDKQAAMRKWMLRLRQTCCHPQVGSSNKQDLGREFKSMGEVLQTMYRQCRSQALTLERTLVTLEVEKGQLNE